MASLLLNSTAPSSASSNLSLSGAPTLQVSGGPLTTKQDFTGNLTGQNLTLNGGSNLSISQPGGLSSAAVQKSAAGVSAAQAAADAQTKQINALLAQINAAQNAYAPTLDLNAITKQASSKAAANVNPYYTKLLNDFVSQQTQARALAEQQHQTDLQNLQDQLQQTLAQNQVTGERAAQDATTQEAQLANQADQRQIDQGTAFDQARRAEAVNLAQRGLTGSGLGAQEQNAAQQAQDTTEARQAQADSEARQAVELSKARTFEDLGTASANATTAEGKAEQQAAFDLNKFILGQTADLKQEQQSLESQRQAALATERRNQTSILVNNFIQAIANPAQRQAALQAYGGFL